jgi:hypothetical protein
MPQVKDKESAGKGKTSKFKRLTGPIHDAGNGAVLTSRPANAL